MKLLKLKRLSFVFVASLSKEERVMTSENVTSLHDSGEIEQFPNA